MTATAASFLKAPPSPRGVGLRTGLCRGEREPIGPESPGHPPPPLPRVCLPQRCPSSGQWPGLSPREIVFVISLQWKSDFLFQTSNPDTGSDKEERGTGLDVRECAVLIVLRCTHGCLLTPMGLENHGLQLGYFRWAWEVHSTTTTSFSHPFPSQSPLSLKKETLHCLPLLSEKAPPATDRYKECLW